VIYPKDFDPTVHEYQQNLLEPSSLLCHACKCMANHHFHTGQYGAECGCEDCLDGIEWLKRVNETLALSQTRRRRFFGRIFNR
jgi:hypothetical protein